MLEWKLKVFRLGISVTLFVWWMAQLKVAGLRLEPWFRH